jgi:type VI secretion system secreted protein Hcp
MKRSIGRFLSILCFAAALVNLPVQGAVDMFLSLGSDIPGESQDQTHRDQVDVLAWSWGMSNSGTTHVGGGGGAGKPSFQDISLTKYVDKSSPLLMLRSANGTHIPKATLYVRKAGQTTIECIKIVMTDVLVTSVSTGGSSGEDRLTENISLNFAKMEFDYVPTNTSGSADKAIIFKWDISNNTGF